MCNLKGENSASICLTYDLPESTTWKFEENDDGTFKDYDVTVEKDGDQILGYSGC